MATGLEHVVCPRNAPFKSPEMCIERRTLASHSSALIIRLYTDRQFTASLMKSYLRYQLIEK